MAILLDNAVEEKYLWAGHNTTLLAVYGPTGTTPIARFEYGVGRMPMRMTQGTNTYYFAYDQVGSLRAVFDDAGALVHEITYDSYGNILTETSNSGLCVPFGFAGGLHDRDTGMVLFGFRDYDPETGTWLTPDPIGFASGDTYLYGYCGGDPVNYVDPRGLWCWDGDWIQYGVGGLFGIYGSEAAASGWTEMDKGLAAGIDGFIFIPGVNPLEFYYASEDGSVDTIYKLSRLSGNISALSASSAGMLYVGGLMATEYGLGQVSALTRFSLGRMAFGETFTIGVNELFGYGSTSLIRSLVEAVPWVWFGTGIIDNGVEIYDIYRDITNTKIRL